MPSELLNIIDWTALKARLHVSGHELFPCKQEIWWASLGQNIGVEIHGKNNRFERPVLVIAVFNTHSLLIAPITSKTGENKYLVNFLNHIGKPNAANISQLRTISTKRLSRKVGKIPNEDFDKVIDAIGTQVLKTETPSSGVSSEPSQ